MNFWTAAIASRTFVMLRNANEPVGGAAKRVLDIAMALIGLVLFAPLLLVIGLIVRLESRGPALFVQRRAGYRGRVFRIYKFRTMTTQTEDCGREQQTAIEDKRITRFGALLRKSCLDELPQLINVLKGDMSIVGPRPHPLSLDKECQEVDPDYQHRQLARPGITGLAQVSGSRGPLLDADDIRRRVRLDIAYLNDWSLGADLWIVVQTAMMIVLRKSAIRAAI